jgi:hypothetical protein
MIDDKHLERRAHEEAVLQYPIPYKHDTVVRQFPSPSKSER